MSFNNDLVVDLAYRKVALFLGAGVSASAVNDQNERLPTWDKFLKDQINGLTGQDKKLAKRYLSTKRHLMSAEIIKESIGAEEWNNRVEREFSKSVNPSELQKSILSLDQRIIITTNFDKTLEAASQEYEKKHKNYRAVYNGLRDDVFKIFRDDRRYIIKLHGSVDDRDTIVFSHSDYIEKAYGSDAYNKFFESLLLNYTILFIGFSMEDPAVSLLMELQAEKYKSCRPHYIMLKKPITRREKELSIRLRRLNIIDYNPENNHHELVETLNELSKNVSEKRKEFLAQELVDAQG